MTGAHVIQPFAVDIHRDIRAGVPIDVSVAARAPDDIRMQFIDAMREVIRRDRDAFSEDHMREGFKLMGLPGPWIDEAFR